MTIQWTHTSGNIACISNIYTYLLSQLFKSWVRCPGCVFCWHCSIWTPLLVYRMQKARWVLVALCIRDSRKSINDLINETENAKPSQEDTDALLTGQRQWLAIKIACFIWSWGENVLHRGKVVEYLLSMLCSACFVSQDDCAFPTAELRNTIIKTRYFRQQYLWYKCSQCIDNCSP